MVHITVMLPWSKEKELGWIGFDVFACWNCICGEVAWFDGDWWWKESQYQYEQCGGFRLRQGNVTDDTIRHPALPRSEVAILQPVVTVEVDGEIPTGIRFGPDKVMVVRKNAAIDTFPASTKETYQCRCQIFFVWT